MEKKRELTKNLLAESFKELMLKTSFEKITIKMITDSAGVIRPTFYNYFQDKYEVMEWLLDEEMFQEVWKMIDSGKEREAIYFVFKKAENDRAYYRKAFEVTGQNGFEEILTRKVKCVLEAVMKRHENAWEKCARTGVLEPFMILQTITMVNGLKYWLSSKGGHLDADEAMEFYTFLVSHSILDIID